AQSTTTTTKTTVTAATTADVDSTSKGLDSGLATTNDSKDFASTDLADASLGL
ncbi:hypothetical protein HY218_00690, partial [Candidatus Saccharibacteria bacterium]|nr:hypothetical protein [Candidatus Saccharibacteria bacterium]